MAKYVYPAIFKPESEGYSITFPDLSNCFTQGEDLADGLEAASDALCLTLYNMEENGKAIPAASDIKAVKAGEGEIVTLVMCDTLEYRRYYDNKAVKKTLTIPAWLNTMAERAGLNFSQVLQNGLKNELHVQ